MYTVRSAPTQGQTQRGRGFPFRGRFFRPGYGVKEGAVGAVSEAEMQRTKLSLMHLHMTSPIMTSTR